MRICRLEEVGSNKIPRISIELTLAEAESVVRGDINFLQWKLGVTVAGIKHILKPNTLKRYEKKHETKT